MLECARTRGPCSLKPLLDPPPPPPPPPAPFPWVYVWGLVSFFGAFGSLYKLYLWREVKRKTSEKDIWRPRNKMKRPYSERDLPDCVQYLIIGTGAAGWAAYRAIMQHDKFAKVFFITKEDFVPYRRPPLSKHMWWNKDPPDVKKLHYVEDSTRKTALNADCADFMDPIKFYRKKTGPAVSLASGWCVLRIDADDHVAWVKTMCGERPIYYERCLLAPGAKPKKLDIIKAAPKAVRDKICLMRTIRDFEIAFRKVKESKHVTVVGAGPLGCELAWFLGKMNTIVERGEDEPPIEIVHVYKDKGVLSGILPEYLGVWAAEQIKCAQVTQIPKAQVYDVFETKDGRLEMTLSNGKSLVTDYAFFALGAEPRVDIAEDSTLEKDDVNGGYLVNTELEARTHLYIAGDAASVYSQWRNTRLRMEHYLNAEEQGFVAGANMTGFWLPCNMEPHYWLRLGESLQVEGFVAGANMTGFWLPCNMEPHYWLRLGESLQVEVIGEVGACMPIVGLFKECEDEESVADADRLITKEQGKRTCYKKKPKGTEYYNRYKRGMLFYLRDEIVVGFVFWNLPAIDDRLEVCNELLRAQPSYREINTLAELLGFVGTQCVYKPPELLEEIGPCIKRFKTW
ncbi:hypothetical protein PYW07_006206 [Mythimna separata]|uniref:Apoptosis-inducing factor 1, mitochondrial n=1 Tax=Mythimna separata TaxID=271217 RepID=A0AAD8DWB9_MYTSE|nr:hypothetical protein PYW07_006206 [Mythimna separata]